LGAAYRRWANYINARGRWRGHHFDGRFASVAIEEAHLMAAVRYVALNPVRARLAARAEDWAGGVRCSCHRSAGRYPILGGPGDFLLY
jgi:putative transposase